jgi:hypothetical protein
VAHEARRILKDDGTIWVIGSYHNIYRVGALAPGRGILDLERHRLAQVQPDAELPRHALHQRPRDPDLVRQGREGALHLQLSCDEGAQRRPSDALGLGASDLQRSGAGEGLRRGKAHPTQKPEALLYRILLACTKPGDVVLDPFFGTGTTGAVARRLGGAGSGSSARRAYVKVARERIASTLAARRERDADRGRQAISQPRVAFGLLVESGLVPPAPCSPIRSGASAPVFAPTDRSSATAIPARSTRWAQRSRARRPATAGPSGTPSDGRRWSRWTRSGSGIWARLPSYTPLGTQYKAHCTAVLPAPFDFVQDERRFAHGTTHSHPPDWLRRLSVRHRRQGRASGWGLNWFSAVELLKIENNRRISSELLSVEQFSSRVDDDLSPFWERLTSPRPPLELGSRTDPARPAAGDGHRQRHARQLFRRRPVRRFRRGGCRRRTNERAGRGDHRCRRRIDQAGRQAGVGGRRDRAGRAGHQAACLRRRRGFGRHPQG